MNAESVTGIVIDERIRLTAGDVCHACGSSTEWLVELVAEGVLDAEGDSPDNWTFSGTALSRAIRARRLQRDFHLNAPGVALVLDMMEEVEHLRRLLRHLDPP